MKSVPSSRIHSISRYSISTAGESAEITFDAGDGTEQALALPFEIIGDLQMSLVHIRAALMDRRRALGAGDSPGLVAVTGLKAGELPGGDLHLHLKTADGVPFHFHLERKFATALVGALNEWLAMTGGADAAPDLR